MSINPSIRGSKPLPHTSAELAAHFINAMRDVATRRKCTLIPNLITTIQKVQGMTSYNFLSWSPSFNCSSKFYGLQCTDLQNRVAVWGLTPELNLFIAFQYVVSINGIPSHRESVTLYGDSKRLTMNHLIPIGANHKVFSVNHHTIIEQLCTLLEGTTLTYTSTNMDTLQRAQYSFSLPTSNQILSLKSESTISLKL